jgi:ankyrin repeat protein
MFQDATCQSIFLPPLREVILGTQHTLRDSKQDPAIYRSLCRALDRNVLTVDVSDEFGRTPLWWAVERGQEAVVRLLAMARGG